jgi:hypothetical protein
MRSQARAPVNATLAVERLPGHENRSAGRSSRFTRSAVASRNCARLSAGWGAHPEARRSGVLVYAPDPGFIMKV